MKGTLTGRCSSCHERHGGDLCPPFEVRTTGVAWFRLYIDELEAKVEQLRHYPRVITEMKEGQFTDRRVCEDIERRVGKAAEAAKERP